MAAGGGTLRAIWREHRVLALALAVAVAVTLALGARFVAKTVYWSQHREARIEDWMTLGYVGRSWSVEPETLAAAAGVEPGAARGRTLAEIARASGEDPAALRARIEAAVAAAREAEPGAAGPGDPPP
jgi:hypothetical protein